MRGQVRLGCHEQIGSEQRNRDERAHPAGARHAHKQARRSCEVDHMIDIEAVPAPLAPADARQRPIEAVTEPIDAERGHHGDGAPRCEADGGKPSPRRDHRRESQDGEAIGRHP